MDNTSHRRSNDEDGSCTATSMYLSFDAESTMSTACYKTLEAMTDISTMSALSIIDDDQGDKHMNSTLENNQDSLLLSALKTVKKMDIMTTSSPLRALPKNIMREYKALSSTPSREQLMKTVDVTRGSDASKCIDLGVAFLGIEDEQPAFFPVPSRLESRRENNKENTIPESVDGSTLSVSSSAEIATSLIEKRFNSVSTTGSLTGDESEAAISVIEKRLLNSISTTGPIMCEDHENEMKADEIINEDILFAKQNIETTPKAKNGGRMIDVEMTEVQPKDNIDCTTKANFEGTGGIVTIAEDDEAPIAYSPKVVVMKELMKVQPIPHVSGKPKIAVLKSRSARRSVCEPNLQTNKPSRISMSVNKRQSLLPVTHKKTSASVEAENEIPLLMNKILKITNSSERNIETETTDKKDDERNPTKTRRPEIIHDVKKSFQPIEKRRSLMPPTAKARTSVMPSTVGEKRPFSFSHRMSVVVKTTLNSPARKIARKSISSATNSLASQQRRSMVATKSTQTLRMNKIDTGVRKSMLPNIKTNTRPTTNSLTNINETATAEQRKSFFPLTKISEDTKPKTKLTEAVRSKLETSFTCNVCKEKFRIKSLLDAHKRSHEGDIVAPTIKKPMTTIAANHNSVGTFQNISNQCKYCDKKFALIRALHIHLLQNCSKIPPSEKRKLQYTEMNHVEKARLPSVFQHSNGTSSNFSSTQATPKALVKHSAEIQIPKITVEFNKEKDFKKNTSNMPAYKGETVAAASSHQKPKKASAHSGVYRTPNKTVPCHTCKTTFKSILEYTNHCLATHGKNAQQQDGDLNRDGVQLM